MRVPCWGLATVAIAFFSCQGNEVVLQSTADASVTTDKHAPTDDGAGAEQEVIADNQVPVDNAISDGAVTDESGANDETITEDKEVPDTDQPVCGNGTVESGEACDGNTRSCLTACGTDGTTLCESNCTWAVTCTVGPDICDGIDNDCDGYMDDYAFVGEILELKASPHYPSGHPSVAWTGSEYRVAYQSDLTVGSQFHMELYLARVSGEGTSLGNAVQITDAYLNNQNAHAAMGAGQLGIAYYREDSPAANLGFMLLDSSGDTLCHEPFLESGANSSAGPFIAYNGTYWGVLWYHFHVAYPGNNTYEMDFMLVDNTCVQVGAATIVQDFTDYNNPSFPKALVWDGENFAALWSFDGGLFFQKISSTGELLGAPINLAPEMGEIYRARMVVANDGYVVLWWQVDAQPYTLSFVHLDDNGAIIDQVENIGFASDSRMGDIDAAYNGAEVLIVYDVYDKSESEMMLHVMRLDLNGQEYGKPFLLPEKSAMSPSVIWDGEHYGLAWGASNDTVKFVRFGCP